jgi:hypothetical protein
LCCPPSPPQPTHRQFHPPTTRPARCPSKPARLGTVLPPPPAVEKRGGVTRPCRSQLNHLIIAYSHLGGNGAEIDEILHTGRPAPALLTPRLLHLFAPPRPAPPGQGGLLTCAGHLPASFPLSTALSSLLVLLSCAAGLGRESSSNLDGELLQPTARRGVPAARSSRVRVLATPRI